MNRILGALGGLFFLAACGGQTADSAGSTNAGASGGEMGVGGTKSGAGGAGTGGTHAGTGGGGKGDGGANAGGMSAGGHPPDPPGGNAGYGGDIAATCDGPAPVCPSCPGVSPPMAWCPGTGAWQCPELHACPPTTGTEGSVCGTTNGTTCGAGLYCAFFDKKCGKTDTGMCRPVPTCDGWDHTAVCGCDGQVYATKCEAAAAGVDLSQEKDHCATPPYSFVCGDQFCVPKGTYCKIEVPDIAGAPTAYSCEYFPPECQDATVGCSCLTNQQCGLSCEGQIATGLTVTCPGG